MIGFAAAGCKIDNASPACPVPEFSWAQMTMMTEESTKHISNPGLNTHTVAR